MIRFTRRITGKKAKYNYTNGCFFADGHMITTETAAFRQAALDRLADYEDIGRTPEEIKKLLETTT